MYRGFSDSQGTNDHKLIDLVFKKLKASSNDDIQNEHIVPTALLSDLGFDSLAITELAVGLEDGLGLHHGAFETLDDRPGLTVQQLFEEVRQAQQEQEVLKQVRIAQESKGKKDKRHYRILPSFTDVTRPIFARAVRRAGLVDDFALV